MIICEVQEYSDLTYRLYDYERVDAKGKARELHVEKAMEVLNFNSNAGGKVATRPRLIRNKKFWEDLVDCPYFSTSKREIDEPTHLKSIGKPSHEFSLWVFLEGEGKIGWSSNPQDMTRSNFGEFSYTQGECWFIPAVFGSHGYYPKKKTNVLMASPLNQKNELKKNGDAD